MTLVNDSGHEIKNGQRFYYEGELQEVIGKINPCETTPDGRVLVKSVNQGLQSEVIPREIGAYFK